MSYQMLHKQPQGSWTAIVVIVCLLAIIGILSACRTTQPPVVVVEKKKIYRLVAVDKDGKRMYETFR